MTGTDRVPVPRCPACAAPERVRAFTGSDLYLRGVAGTFEYVRCSRCATVYGDPQASDDELTAAYDVSYGPYSEDQSLLERLGEPLAQREADRIVANAAGQELLVDVGCGRGTMLRRARRAGWRGTLHGIEPSEEVAARTREVVGATVDVSTVEAVDLEPDSVDVIILRHVIEHVRDPEAVLRTLRAALKPGGIIYVATPDRRALTERVFRSYWHGYDPPRHLHAFTSGGMRTLLDRVGLEVVEQRWDFSPQMWSASLHHRLQDTRVRRRAAVLASLFNPVVGAVALVGGLLELVLRRSTMYGVIARRPA